jgi:putative transposase
MVTGMCRDWMISIRRACGALDFDRSTYHYTSRRADDRVHGSGVADG